MKTTRIHAIILMLLFSVSNCQKPAEEIKDQKSLLYNEQANPGITGETQEFIINGNTITCELINGNYVFQGDMILTKEQLFTAGSSKGAGLQSFVNKWTNNTVYYMIDEELPNNSRITDAIKYWEENTPIKFINYNNAIFGDDVHDSYLRIIRDNDGCYSNVGMLYGSNGLNGFNYIGIADWADKGTVIHEIGHTVGLTHEHSRIDRDAHVTINLANVETGKEHSFDKVNTQLNSSKFDFNSIMLYSSYAFSKNGLPTITKLDGSTFEAQREILSQEDINVIKSIYLSPEIKSHGPINITDQSATFEYDIISPDEEKIIETGIYFGTSPDPEITGTKRSLGRETGSFNTILTGLSPNTIYYVKAFASNNLGIFYGCQVIVKTMTSKVTDIEGNAYYTVTIGNQLWMAENLRVTKLNDGTSITNVTDTIDWGKCSSSAYCWYDNNIANKDNYGALYNHYTIKTGKLCPTNWHVASEDDWKTMEMHLGMSQAETEILSERGTHNEGGKLKEASTRYWSHGLITNWYYHPPLGATNESGFTALPGGVRYPPAYIIGSEKEIPYTFHLLTHAGYWWTSSSEENDTGATIRILYGQLDAITKSGFINKCGLSVRCIED